MPAVTDAQLLPLAAAGNPDSLAELYERHRDGALAVAISVLADVADAEDVVQDVFVQLPRMAGSYDPDRGEPTQWLLRSVRNRAIDHYRRRARHQHRLAPTADDRDDPLELVAASGTSPAEEAEADEFLDLLGRLDARHAQLIRLAFVEGWSHSAIAGITGLPLGTVKSRIRIGLRLVRSLVAEMDVTPVRGRPGPPPGDGPLVVVTHDSTFGRRIGSLARDLAPVEVVSGVPGDSAYRPAAVIFDVRAAQTPTSQLSERLAAIGWNAIPALAWTSRWRVRPLGPAVQSTGARALGRALRGSAQAAVAALLSTTSDPAVHRPAIDRLLNSDGLALLAGDRLGRVTAATRGASLIFGRPPRQLVGMNVTELSAMPKDWTERQWQGLVGAGWWAGSGIARVAGGSRPTGSVAWLVPSGGFLSAVVALDP